MMGRGITGLVFAIPLLAGLLLAGCGGDPGHVPEETADEAAHMTPAEADAAEHAALARCGYVGGEGYCGVKFGMAVAEAMKLFPVKLEGYDFPAEGESPADDCHELFAALPVRGISFLVEKGVIGRVDVISGTARTSEGFGVGTQASALRTRFGDAMGVNVNDLEPEITDLSVTEGGIKFVFEIQDGVVRAWRAGVPPTIDYVAHCSPN